MRQIIYNQLIFSQLSENLTWVGSYHQATFNLLTVVR